VTFDDTHAAAEAFRALDEVHRFARQAGVRPPSLDDLLARLAPGVSWGDPLVRTLIDADRALRRPR
jgi:hypothetical protein